MTSRLRARCCITGACAVLGKGEKDGSEPTLHRANRRARGRGAVVRMDGINIKHNNIDSYR